MKTSKRNRLLGLALTGGFSLFGASGAFAAAGDVISNTATLGYSVGGTAQTGIESGTGAGNSIPGAGNGTATTFMEDRLINFNVVRGGATGTAVPGGTLQSVQYTLTNTGNGSQGFLLKGLNNADGTADPWGGTNDEFDATAVQTFVESGVTGGFQPAEDTAAFVATLAGADSVDVYVVSTIPLVDTGGAPLVNANVAVMTLVAQAAIPASTGIAGDAVVADDNGNASPGGTGFTNGTADVTAGVAATIADDPATEQIVFNDADGTQAGTGVADIVKNAQHSDDSSYTIQSAALTVAKVSSALWDFVNLNVSPKSIPGGSVIRYTVTVTNAAGAADATLTSIIDDLPLSLDAQFGDGNAANAPVSGANNVRITDGLGAVVFCQADAGDTTPVDGCDSAFGGTANRLSVDLSAVAGITNVLQATQTLTIEFDVVLP